MNFQDLILSLQNYWAEKGCCLIQPYDLEMGAGTFHPSTFFWHFRKKTLCHCLSPTLQKTKGRSLRRKSQSFSTLLSVSSDYQANSG